MRKWWLIGALAVVVVSTLADDASAFGRRRSRPSVSSWYSTGTHGEYAATAEEAAARYNGLTLQEIAQLRADAMAAAGVLSHEIHLTAAVPSWAGIGVGEGIGCSTVSDPSQCATCIVGSRVVADAHARSRGGMLFRVRFFR